MNITLRDPHTYEPDSPLARAARIHGIARVGMAACDTALVIDLERSGYEYTFAAIASIADTLMYDLGSLDGTKTVPAQLEEWKASRACMIERAEAEGDAYTDSAEYEKELEALGALADKIAQSSPDSFADAAAMLEWSVLDSDNGATTNPKYPQVQKSVAEFLRDIGSHL